MHSKTKMGNRLSDVPFLKYPYSRDTCKRFQVRKKRAEIYGSMRYAHFSILHDTAFVQNGFPFLRLIQDLT